MVREEKHLHEPMKQQHIPVKMYRTYDRLIVAAPMPGLEPENIVVEVAEDGHLMLHGDLRSMLKDVKELLVDEWSVGAYHRELDLPVTTSVYVLATCLCLPTCYQ
jgi:HSP20 family protein